MKAMMLERLKNLSTPHLADSCLRLGLQVRVAPTALLPVSTTMRCVGRAKPVRHVGSVDILLESLDSAKHGDVLVIDNNGRMDEACIGDLIVLEAHVAGLAGVIVWGLHRDSAEIIEIGLPVFSMGAIPTGPRRLDSRPAAALTSAAVGSALVTSDDVVVGDRDGIIFLAQDSLSTLITAAEMIRETERKQAVQMRQGRSFRSQSDFKGYIESRRVGRVMNFREHLRLIGSAVEE